MHIVVVTSFQVGRPRGSSTRRTLVPFPTTCALSVCALVFRGFFVFVVVPLLSFSFCIVGVAHNLIKFRHDDDELLFFI